MITNQEEEFLKQSNLIEGEPAIGEALEDAKNAWAFIKDIKDIWSIDIRECHAILMRSRETIGEEDKGAWSRFQTYVGGHKSASPDQIPDLIQVWLNKFIEDVCLFEEGKLKGTDLELLARMRHIEFEKIHPFLDGNGRVGRILYNWQRLRFGLEIEIIWEKEKYDYYTWFN